MADHPTQEQDDAARIRIVADCIRKASAYRMGVSKLSPLETAADLPWLEGVARNVLTALASADTDAALAARTPMPGTQGGRRDRLVERLRALIEWMAERDSGRAVELDGVVHALETLASAQQPVASAIYRCDQSDHPSVPCSRCEVVTPAPLSADPPSPRGSGPLAGCCGHHRERCQFGHQHRWTSPWMENGRILRTVDTAKCHACGSVCTGEEEPSAPLPAVPDGEDLRERAVRGLPRGCVVSGPWTRHGHDIPGVTVAGGRPPAVARCGGPALCRQCREDVAQAHGETSVTPDRPTQTQLNATLRVAEDGRGDAHDARLLAVEVRALRAELDGLRIGLDVETRRADDWQRVADGLAEDAARAAGVARTPQPDEVDAVRAELYEFAPPPWEAINYEVHAGGELLFEALGERSHEENSRIADVVVRFFNAAAPLPAVPDADVHRPETVTALHGTCAQEACDHSGNPGDECPWVRIRVCATCSYGGVDLAQVDAVPVTPWPCSVEAERAAVAVAEAGDRVYAATTELERRQAVLDHHRARERREEGR